MPDIYEYINYRKLMADLYTDKKAQFAHFSYRYIAQKVGFTSAGFFTNILQGKRNISSENIFKFAQLFKLKRSETEYFELLVLFDQAKNHEQKKYYFEKILASKKSKIKITDRQHYEFYSKWYYTAVREVLDVYRFTGDYAELAKKISPSITPAEAKKAVGLLHAMG
ncbi:MAG: TIGR02147 family protein, partial [Chitinivibrionales bacterium]|nr:TIGR02147 family protein [Chitinivibrionales bacterium]